MNLLFNKQGDPLMGFGTRAFMSTTGFPAPSSTDHTSSKTVSSSDEKITLDKLEISPWGTNNNFPQLANEIISKTGVLNSGLKFIRNFTLGQGIFPCRVIGYDDKGNEKLEVIDNLELQRFCAGRMVRRYLEKAARDYFKYGPAFPELIANADGSKIVGINTINALHARYTIANKNGEIQKCVISGTWPDQPAEKTDYKVLEVLDDYDPEADLERRRLDRSIKDNLIYPIRDTWSNADYYSTPVWYAAKLAGWIDVANKVPMFLAKAYENEISWKWHVRIPYAYWDKKFPPTQYKDDSERQKQITDYMDKFEQSLTAPENANKALFTFFEMGPGGKAEEKWEIDALDNKGKGGDNLITSAAANSEILFALTLNPNVMGAGMPGGTYAGNQGGSNIREAFLVNVANAWLDRQNLLDPVEAYLRFNGVKDIELRFRNTILTTLDTGSGSTKTLS